MPEIPKSSAPEVVRVAEVLLWAQAALGGLVLMLGFAGVKPFRVAYLSKTELVFAILVAGSGWLLLRWRRRRPLVRIGALGLAIFTLVAAVLQEVAAYYSDGIFRSVAGLLAIAMLVCLTRRAAKEHFHPKEDDPVPSPRPQ